MASSAVLYLYSFLENLQLDILQCSTRALRTGTCKGPGVLTAAGTLKMVEACCPLPFKDMKALLPHVLG